MDDYRRIRQASIGGVTGTWTYDANNMLSQIAATGVQQYDYSFNVNTIAVPCAGSFSRLSINLAYSVLRDGNFLTSRLGCLSNGGMVTIL